MVLSFRFVVSIFTQGHLFYRGKGELGKGRAAMAIDKNEECKSLAINVKAVSTVC